MNETLFFAIFPDEATARLLMRRAAATRRQYGFQARTIAAERLHISLLNVGDYDPQRIAQLCTLAATITAAPFEVTFDRALSFNHRENHYPFVLAGDSGLVALKDFANLLRDSFGCGQRQLSTPHLTLLWDARKIAPHAIKPVSWTVREFALVRSFIGESRYEILGRWPLHSAPHTPDKSQITRFNPL